MEQVHTLPGFDHALTSWQNFLREQGYVGNVLWIFRDDITWHDGRFFLRLPLPEMNQSLVSQIYERGCENGLGVTLSFFASSQTTAIAISGFQKMRVRRSWRS